MEDDLTEKFMEKYSVINDKKLRGFTDKAKRAQFAYRLKRLSEKKSAQPGIHLTPSTTPTFAPLG